ncbi:hypothetical protein 1 [Changjiang tombus-like virus 16]|uniref:hypothetical protein 1 n=1 Tax=Changjiang tombus-like virus 16 TaxID=1922809 RepID=UPI00090A3ED2|nr:hypothetical protein 1 [Changjiang tombus-like virus 16]APG76227.1 hypothetical protein 1 [Changjiang tombus-like virus 16]
MATFDLGAAERQLDGAIGVISKGFKLGVMVCGVCTAGYLAYRYVPRLWRLMEVMDHSLTGKERAMELQSKAVEYVPDEDTDEEEADVGAEDNDAPPGLGRRGPAARRRARKEKHTGMDGVPLTNYYASIVSEARVHYGYKGYSSYNAALARAYMVRLMTEHNVRKAHMLENLEDMVNAVFAVSAVDRRAQLEREAGLLFGWMRRAQNC